MSQKFIFTTLPHKVINEGGTRKLKVSVAVSIRLDVVKDSFLSAFPDVMNWVSTLEKTEFQFRFSNGKSYPAALNAKPLDSTLWKSLFYNEVKVKGFVQDNFTAKRIHSYPVRHVNDFVMKAVRDIAIQSPERMVSPFNLVENNDLRILSRIEFDERGLNELAQLRFAPVQGQETRRPQRKIEARQLLKPRVMAEQQHLSLLKTNKFIPFSAIAQPESDFAQFRDFHKLNKKTSQKTFAKLSKPEFEFHEILSVVSGYPQIQRKLGLVLDFEIPFESSMPSEGHLHFVPAPLEMQSAGTLFSAPSTAYRLTDTGFFVRAKSDSAFLDGFVKINTNMFTVYQGDIDGVAIKTNNLVEVKTREMADFHAHRFNLLVDSDITVKPLSLPVAPKEEGLPAVRSAGFAIARNGLAAHLNERFAMAVELQTSLLNISLARQEFKAIVSDRILFADDVVQGYRMDVAYAENPEKWHSLHQRKQTYKWYDRDNAPHSIDVDENDEGFVELALAEDDDDTDDVFVPETIARWEGWSLSVNRPGFAINEAIDDDKDVNKRKDFIHSDKTKEAVKYKFDTSMPFRIHAQSAVVAGTLPRLRFGKEYLFRIRTVDIAGNSVDLASHSSNPASTVVKNMRYMRYEPLGSPIVLVGNEMRQGESLEQMVIRSNYNLSATDFEKLHGYEGESVRYFMPPQNSQQIAEMHGKFDAYIGVSPEAAKKAYDLITSLEQVYQRLPNGKDKVYQPSEVEVIYLPDPMAAGVALFLAPGFETTHSNVFSPTMFSYFTNDELSPDKTNQAAPDEWFKARHVRIRLLEGKEIKSEWVSSQRMLNVYLPKGYRMMLKFSTFWRESDLKQLSAVWDLVKRESPQNLAQIDLLAKSGRHWMVSPAREMELVHAVMQPVEAPVVQDLIPAREFGKTDADIHIRFSVHGESTQSAGFQACWVDPVDDGISPEISELKSSNFIPDVNIGYHDDLITRGVVPEENRPGAYANLKGLSLHRKVKSVKPLNQYQIKVEDTVFASSKFKFQFDEQYKYHALLSLAPLKQEFGDTKHRWVDYQVTAATRYPGYFEQVLASMAEPGELIRKSEWIEKVNILSTVRPIPVEIDYVIPTFEWRKTQTDKSFRHRRLGGGLRVFIKRPWFSSGVDEMLGVVLMPPAGIKPMMAGMVQGYTDNYTHWGIDPIHISLPPSQTGPQPEDFRHTKTHDKEVEYPGKENVKAQVVGYPVEFDKQRQMWCCDLAINPGTMYFPFVRLALARYQPHSLRDNGSDVCLSQVVLAPMMQLVPDRQSTLTFHDDAKNSRFTITVEGTLHNDYRKAFGVMNYIVITFIDTRLVQPIYGLVDDGKSNVQLQEEKHRIDITDALISGSYFKISKEFRLPGDYKRAPFEVVIEEYESHPDKSILPREYRELLENPEERARLVYADVFKINEISK